MITPLLCKGGNSSGGFRKVEKIPAHFVVIDRVFRIVYDQKTQPCMEAGSWMR